MILPSSFKRNARYKITIYVDAEKSTEIQSYFTENVHRIEDFTVKKLIENSEKVKISSVFEYNRKKVMKVLYNNLSEAFNLDSVAVQELND